MWCVYDNDKLVDLPNRRHTQCPSAQHHQYVRYSLFMVTAVYLHCKKMLIFHNSITLTVWSYAGSDYN